MIEQTMVNPGTLPVSALELEYYLEGRVILPETEEYNQARLAWNRYVDQFPALIVIPKNAQDIATAVLFAHRNNFGVAVQATGHGVHRQANGGLLILTREMTGIKVDPITRTARLEAGVEWGPVLKATQEHGLAPLLGSSPNVGAVGYTLGGGFGWLGRKYGLSADNVISFEVVTADGQIQTVSETENSDLFWGMRGGGSLAIVTTMTIRLFPVTHVYAGNLYYPTNMAPEVFHRYRDWIKYMPQDMTSSIVVINYPPAPALPDFLRGQSYVIIRGCYAGSIEDGQEMLRYWRDWQAPTVDDFKTISFGDAATISNDPLDPLPGISSTRWLSEISDEVIETLIHYGFPKDTPPQFVLAEIRHAGGALKNVSPDAAVYGNRDAELLLQVIGVTPTQAIHNHVNAYIQEMLQAILPYQTGGVYMNFLEGPESQDRVRDGLVVGGYERLARLKTKYDPENIIRYSFNISPA